MKKKFSWKNLLSILLLICCYPLGLVVLWILPSWKRDVKLLITSSVLVPLSFFILPSFLPSCELSPHLSPVATSAFIFIPILIFSAFLLSRKRKSSRSLWIKTLYVLELVIAITGSLLVSGMQCFYSSIPASPPLEKETVKMVLIKHISGGMTGSATTWVRISEKGNEWLMERCQSHTESFLCCNQVLENTAITAILERINDTDTSISDKAIITDVYSKYEVSIDTTHRQLWLESVSNIPVGWNVISQTEDHREIFQMGGKEFSETIFHLPECKEKEKQKEPDWKIFQPLSLLARYSPKLLDGLRLDEDTTFTSFQPFSEMGGKFGVLDIFNKGWLDKKVPSYVNSPSVELLILAFKNEEGMRSFQQEILQNYSTTATASRSEEITIQGFRGKKYNFYGRSPELLEEPFEGGDVTLLVFAKKNLLFFAISTQHLREQSSDKYADLLIENLNLNVKDPEYSHEGKEVAFGGELFEQEAIFANVEKCLDLESRVERYECIDRVARVTGELEVCRVYQRPVFNYLENPEEYIELCYINAAIGKKDTSICKNLKTYTPQECLDLYHLKLAGEKTEPSSCQGIENEDKYHWCLEDQVKATGNISLCEKARNEYNREWCYRDYARFPEECDKISGASRAYCLERLAVQYNQPSLCERIDGTDKLGEIIKKRCQEKF